MTNILKEQQQANKEPLNEIKTSKKQLADKDQGTEKFKVPLQFKQLNNEEIRAWIATILSESHYTDNPDVDVVGEIMKVYCDQEKWSGFCKMFLLNQFIGM